VNESESVDGGGQLLRQGHFRRGKQCSDPYVSYGCFGRHAIMRKTGRDVSSTVTKLTAGVLDETEFTHVC
jgi:hypothetical protein